MNANELADELQVRYKYEECSECMLEAATMLRQQQAEIAELKVMLGHYEDVYEGVVTHPVKELTQSEFENIFDACYIGDDYNTQYDFKQMLELINQAVLRKAQEKC